MREALAREWIELQALRFTNYRALGTYERTGVPGPEGSGVKLRWSEANQRLTKLARELRGPDGILDDGWWNHQQLRSRGNTIEAGHVGGLAQHHRRARPRPPEVALMDFALNDDQLELKQAARAWLADRFPLDRDWEAQDDRWSELEELGWLDVAEAGLGFVEEALLLEEMGYVCYPGFYLGHVASISGPTATSQPSTPPAALLQVEDETPRFRAAAAAEALGVAQRALDLGVEHAKTRVQFGKPIGTYQAVSHPLAQTYTDVELARSLVYWAAWCVAEEDERAPLAAAAAKAFATEAAVAACERSIQAHGGIGFTWEHPLHRFYKRALWLEGFGRRPAELRLEVADAVLA